MNSRWVTRTSRGLAGAVVMSLLLTVDTLAAPWEAAVVLSRPTSESMAGGLVVLDDSTVVAVYNDWDRVVVRRTIDAGASWEAPVVIAYHAVADSWRSPLPEIAGSGSNVDVVWLHWDRVVRYARSTNSGASFSQSVELSSSSPDQGFPSVAHGPGGLVAVAWADPSTRAVMIRVSHDNGASFASAVAVSPHGVYRVDGPVVALGDGVIYVAYSDRSSTLRVRRSLDSGATWQGVLHESNAATPAATAEGATAYITYRHGSTYLPSVRYIRTADRGASWSLEMNLSPASWNAWKPQIALHDGVVRALFSRCGAFEGWCIGNRVFYRQSSDGVTWTTPTRVSSKHHQTEATGAGVGIAGAATLVLYDGWGRDGRLHVYARRGTP